MLKRMATLYVICRLNFNPAENTVESDDLLEILLYSKTYVINAVAGRADKEPPGGIRLSPEHGMKTVFVITRWTDFKIAFYQYVFDFVIHGCFLS
jgi:hypothetical protein